MPILVSSGGDKVAWHRGLLIKRRIDPVAHARLFFPVGMAWRTLSVGAQGAVEWDQDSPSMAEPKACYPIWQYGESMELLEELLGSNVADDLLERSDPAIEAQYRPKEGQEHRVVIGSYPPLNSGPGRRLLVLLGELQDSYPDAILHLFSATTFRPVFSSGVRSADIDVFTTAAGGRVMLPNGKLVHRDKLSGHRQWVALLGNSVADLGTKEERLGYNIRSALYASENWSKTETFTTRTQKADDALGELPTTTPRMNIYLGKPGPLDRISCDSCTLSDSCKYYRQGSVCNVPSSETKGLAHYFKTRDSDRIIEGLGELLATQARRAEGALEVEEQAGELDPEVSRVISQMFDGAVKLAKLVNPALAAAGAPKIGIQVNSGNTMVTAANPAALMGALVRELEAKGIPRAEITPEMVVGLIDKPDAIEVGVRE